MRTGNLLDSHPGGLGKHIWIYAGHRGDFTEKEIVECINSGGIPYFIETPRGTFYIEIGSDLVLEESLDFHDSKAIHDKLAELSYWIDQAYEYVDIHYPYTRLLLLYV